MVSPHFNNSYQNSGNQGSNLVSFVSMPMLIGGEYYTTSGYPYFSGPQGCLETEPERCKVCEDYASGVHFGVLTCEGCKGFFKRNHKDHQGKTLSCSREQNCEINPTTRNTCRYCRYQKCIKSGMSRDAIKLGRRSKTDKVTLHKDYEKRPQGFFPQSIQSINDSLRSTIFDFEKSTPRPYMTASSGAGLNAFYNQESTYAPNGYRCTEPTPYSNSLSNMAVYAVDNNIVDMSTAEYQGCRSATSNTPYPAYHGLQHDASLLQNSLFRDEPTNY